MDEPSTPQSAAAPVLEPAAQTIAHAASLPPFVFELPIDEGRRSVDAAQDGDFPEPATCSEDVTIPVGDGAQVRATIYRPPGHWDVLPVVVYTHGAGWAFGSQHTHDRLVRELTVKACAATLFVKYSLSPEAKYPTAIEEVYAALQWVAAHGSSRGLDPDRVAIAGDSVGGNMTAAVALLAKQRGGPVIVGQLLYYPATDASFDTDSYRQFATGYWLRCDGMQWCWDQYTTGPAQRAEITASPLRASRDELTGLPEAMIITGEADVLRDEGEAYAAHLRAAGVAVTAIRYLGTIHDFAMLHALKDTTAAIAATDQGGRFLHSVLHQKGES